jgi:DNA repair protein RadC
MTQLVRIADVLADRPRERMWRRGVHVLADDELLAAVLGTGVRARPARVIANALAAAGGLAALSRASPRELALTTGIGEAGAARVAAAFELGRRAIEAAPQLQRLLGPEDLACRLRPRVAGLQQEVFFAIGIDVRNRVLDIVEVARGSVHGVDVHPREVFRPLLRMAATGGLIAHNHPSGDPTPSQEDFELTRRLRDVGHLVGIPIVDHVIVGAATSCSIAEYLGTEL